MSTAPSYADVHQRSITERDAYWAEQAKLIDWQTPPQRICNNDKAPFTRWFEGGTTNLCHNAVDRHLSARAQQNALILVSTEVDQERVYSYRELHAEVQVMAAVLLSQGVKQGDRVLIYMPMIPEAVFAMLACTRIGAVHSVVFGGFASVSLASRIEDAEPTLVVSADAGSRGGKVVPYKPLLDEALRLSAHKVPKVLMVDRGLSPMSLEPGRDLDYALLRQQHLGTEVPVVWLDSTAISYTIYTSGTTGRPKGVQRDDARFVNTYWKSVPERLVYSTFDWGIRDADGYYFILGRTDDVINVAGHRLGTREIEESISSHPAVAEVAVVGVADQLKGQVAMAFAVLKDASLAATPAAALKLEGEVMKRVDEQLGAVARPARVRFVTTLPKTRSGKLLRRAIQAVCEGRDPGDLTTIEDPSALQQVKDAVAG